MTDHPHWHLFKAFDEEPNDWTVDVVDETELQIDNGVYRIVVESQLVERERTHDRYFAVCYPTTTQDGDEELLAFHLGRDEAIARNNVSYARDVLEGDGTPHVVVRDHADGPRETFKFPAEALAEQAADLQTRLKLEDPDRDYLVAVESKLDWEDRLALEASIDHDHSR